MEEKKLEELLEEVICRLDKLEANFEKLKEWSDLNDYWLREMINSLALSVDKLLDIDHEGEY